VRWLPSARWRYRRVVTAVPHPTQAESVDAGPFRVEHRGGDTFDINIRGHVVTVDQPVRDGGQDTAPTPTELFIASLASCVAFYARRYLARHALPTDGLAVEATFEMGAKPARVAGIGLRLIVPEGVPVERLDALLAVATHCTVHNTLASEPEVTITLAG
jgi:putative redox protein